MVTSDNYSSGLARLSKLTFRLAVSTTGCRQQGHVRSQIMVVILSQFCFNEEVLTVKKVLVAKLSLKILASELSGNFASNGIRTCQKIR